MTTAEIDAQVKIVVFDSTVDGFGVDRTIRYQMRIFVLDPRGGDRSSPGQDEWWSHKAVRFAPLHGIST